MVQRASPTIAELTLILCVALLILLATSAQSLPYPSRDATWPAAIEVRTYVDLARIEAVRLRRPCRFLLDTDRRRLVVLDGRGTATVDDDEALYERRLDDAVALTAFESDPAASGPQLVAPASVAVTFGPSGLLERPGDGIALTDGRNSRRVELLASGTTRVEVWDGASWAPDR